MRIELVFGGCVAPSACRVTLQFQYPLADRVGFWGGRFPTCRQTRQSFSILLRIELVFGALCRTTPTRINHRFSILLRIELVFGGWRPAPRPMRYAVVSVSSCGSSWFLGVSTVVHPFSYQNVSVSSCGSSWFLGGRACTRSNSVPLRFSILLRIELVFGAGRRAPRLVWLRGFQYPLADRVGFWGRMQYRQTRAHDSFSILLRIELVFGGHSDD